MLNIVSFFNLAAELSTHSMFFGFPHHPLGTLETVVCKNPKRLAVSEMLKRSGTSSHAMVKVAVKLVSV